MQQVSPTPTLDHMSISNAITWVISLLALALASFSLYLQRRDRRPRLMLDCNRKQANIEIAESDARGFPKTVEEDVVEVSAANSTDKQINITSIEFEPNIGKSFPAPLHKTIQEVPSYQVRHAIVAYDELMQEIKRRGYHDATKGRIVLYDALGKAYKTNRFRL